MNSTGELVDIMDAAFACAYLATPYAVAHGLPSSSLAAAATRSGSKPNFSWSAFRGAEAPKLSCR